MPKNKDLLDAVEARDLDRLSRVLLDPPENIDLIDYLNQVDYLHQTVLILAVTLQDEPMVAMLLSFNPDLYIQSYSFGTALTAAIFFKNWKLVDLLIKAEVEIHEKFDPKRHPSAFCWAIRSGNEGLVKYFIEAGSSLNSSNVENFEEHPDWVWGELADLPCPFQSNPLDQRFDLPLNIAVSANHLGIVSLLIRAGADPKQKGYAGQDALTLADYSDNPEIMRQALAGKIPAPPAIEHDPIPLELQESFKDLIEDHVDTVIEAQKPENLIELLQQPSKASSDHLTYVIRRSAFLDSTFSTGYTKTIVFLLCCLYPDYWEEPLLAIFKKEVLQTGYVERASAAASTAAEKQEKEQFLKKIAQDYCTTLFTQRKISLIRDRDLRRPGVHRLPTDVLWRNDPSELACFTPIKGIKRDPEYIEKILQALVYQSKKSCSLMNLPQHFPTPSAIRYYRREWKQRGIYEPLLQQFSQLQTEREAMIAQESQQATTHKSSSYDPTFLQSGASKGSAVGDGNGGGAVLGEKHVP